MDFARVLFVKGADRVENRLSSKVRAVTEEHLDGAGRGEWLIPLALFLLAFALRTVDLALFITADENTWLGRSVRFFQAISRGDWGATLIEDAVPGITTQWAGVLGLAFHYLPHLSWGDGGVLLGGGPLVDGFEASLSVLAATRYPIGAVTSLFVVAVYFVMRKMRGRCVALLAAFFLAFDPFYVALCRVLGHDALHATFAVLSVLVLMLGWQEGKKRYFVLSGVCGGLAFLSRSIGATLFPIALVLSLLAHLAQPMASRRRERLVSGLLLWSGAAAVTVFALWPSMWVQPLQTVRAVFQLASRYREVPHVGGDFFWGRPVADPGPFYYLVDLVFRSSPLVLVGAFFSAVSLGRRLRNSVRSVLDRRKIGHLSLWVLAAAYLVMLSFGAKKQDRYILPAILALDLAAAIGWIWFTETVGARWFRAAQRNVATVVGGLLVAAQVALCVNYHPYYFSYYNPVLGGAWTAPKTMLVGWGEGLDQAGRYLEAKEEADRLVVGVLWPDIFDYYFGGTVYESKFPPPVEHRARGWPFALDYAVVYISGLQRYGLPRSFADIVSPEEEELAVDINGITYASVYRIPEERLKALPEDAVPVGIRYIDGLELVGYKTYPVEMARGRRGYQIPLTLYWRMEQSCPKEYYVALRLLNYAGDVWALERFFPPCTDWQPSWRGDWVLPEDLEVSILPGTPLGSYELEATVQRIPGRERLEARGASGALLGPIEVPRHMGFAPDVLDVEREVGAVLGDKIELLGYNLDQGREYLHLTLFWQCLKPVGEDYTVFVHVLDGEGRLVGQEDMEPVHGFHATGSWLAGEVVRDQYEIPLSQAAGRTRFKVGMYLPASGERLPVRLADGSRPEDRAILLPGVAE